MSITREINIVRSMVEDRLDSSDGLAKEAGAIICLLTVLDLLVRAELRLIEESALTISKAEVEETVMKAFVVIEEDDDDDDDFEEHDDFFDDDDDDDEDDDDEDDEEDEWC